MEEQNKRLTDVKEGDLVLCVFKNKGNVSPYLIVVDRIGFSLDGNAYFSPRSPAYKLPSLNSAFEISGVQVRSQKDAVYEYRLSDCLVGKKAIGDYLSNKGMEMHAEWVKRLSEKPDRLPKCKRLEYIPLD